MIPKILLQTSKEKLPQYVLDNIYKHTIGWKYTHFVDSEIIDFFNENPIDELPNVVEVFNSIQRGEYKADLFRYYFLYLNGGVFVDSDLELKIDLTQYINNYNYFTVQASEPNEDCYFQGLLAVEPKNKIIYKALIDTYKIFKNNIQLSHYVELCQRFKQISLKHENEYNTKIFKEIDFNGYTKIVDSNSNNDIIAVHFHVCSIIPPPIDGVENTSRNQIIRSIYLNRLKREPDDSGLNHYVNSDLCIQGIDNIIADSPECKALNKKINF